MELQVPVISSKHFTHCSKSKRLLTDISDLNCRLPLAPLYDDACDVGLALRNEKTGNVTRWALADTVQQDGDVLGWYFVPCTESVRKNKALMGYCMQVVND